MAKGFTVTATIDRSADEVWQFICDFQHAHRWMPGISGMRPADDGPMSQGKRFYFQFRGRERATQISTWQPPRRFALTSTQGGVTATYVYEVADQGNATKVQLDAACEARGLWKVIHPLIVHLMRKADGGQLENVKAVLEGQDGE